VRLDDGPAGGLSLVSEPAETWVGTRRGLFDLHQLRQLAEQLRLAPGRRLA